MNLIKKKRLVISIMLGLFFCLFKITSANNGVSIGLSIFPPENPDPPGFNIEILNYYQVRFYGRTAPYGEVHLSLGDEATYSFSEIIEADKYGNWSYLSNALNKAIYKSSAYVVDGLGNTSEATSDMYFNIVLYEPSIEIIVLSSGKAKISGDGFPGGRVILNFSGPNEYSLTDELIVNNDMLWEYETEALNPGNYSVAAHVVDKNDNTGPSSQSEGFLIANNIIDDNLVSAESSSRKKRDLSRKKSNQVVSIQNTIANSVADIGLKTSLSLNEVFDQKIQNKNNAENQEKPVDIINKSILVTTTLLIVASGLLLSFIKTITLLFKK